jgi:hypothetical protein
MLLGGGRSTPPKQAASGSPQLARSLCPHQIQSNEPVPLVRSFSNASGSTMVGEHRYHGRDHASFSVVVSPLPPPPPPNVLCFPISNFASAVYMIY